MVSFSVRGGGPFSVRGDFTMFESPLSRVRRWVGLGSLTFLSSWVVWTLTAGYAGLGAPLGEHKVKEAGLVLFEHDWKPGDSLASGDGLGPVFNERSCVACHFQGGVGGGGDMKHNVTSFEVHPVPGRPEVMGGVLHKFALSKDCRESQTGLHDFFAVVPGGLKIIGGCRIEIRDFDPVRIHSYQRDSLVRRRLDRQDIGQEHCAPEPEPSHSRQLAKSCWPISTVSSQVDHACWPTVESVNSAGRPSLPRSKSSLRRPVPTSSVWATR